MVLNFELNQMVGWGERDQHTKKMLMGCQVENVFFSSNGVVLPDKIHNFFLVVIIGY